MIQRVIASYVLGIGVELQTPDCRPNGKQNGKRQQKHYHKPNTALG